MANKRWTDEDIEDLRERVAAGQGVPRIAIDLQRSQEATRARMQMLGLTKPRQFKGDRPAETLSCATAAGVPDFAEATSAAEQ